MIGLLVAKNIDQALFFMCMLGVTFPGVNIVTINYIMEFTLEEDQSTLFSKFFAFEQCTYLALTYYYKNINRSYFGPQMFGACIALLCIVLIYQLVPESPKFLYSKGKFNEARKILMNMHKFNFGNNKEDREILTNQFDFEFDTESGDQHQTPPLMDSISEDDEI